MLNPKLKKYFFVAISLVLFGGLFSVASARDFIIRNVAAPSTIWLKVDGTTGNVGIGAAPSGYKLDVTGTSRFTEDVLLNKDLSWSYQELDFAALPRTNTNPMSIRLFDNYSQAGAPTTYGTVMEIYGYGAHEDSQLYFGHDGSIRYRDAFYAEDVWPAWKTLAFTDSPLTGTLSAANVSSGDFGANTGGGNYSFPGSLGVGAVLAGVNMNISGTLAAPAKMYVTNTGGTWVDEGEIGRYGFYTTDSSGIGARELAGIRGVSGQAGTTAAGELAFYTSLYNTAGAEAMRIDKSGNVGIGTISPSDKLHVSTGSIGLSNTNSVNTSQGTVKFYSPTYPAAYAGIEGKTNADGTNQLDLLFYTAYGSAAEKMRILSNSGNVGIGTSAPGQKLTVAGTIESTSGGVKFPDGTTQATAYLGGSQTVTAANVSAGDFGANTGGGNYTFPASVSIGTTNNEGGVSLRQNMSDYGTSFTSPHIKLIAGNTVDTTGFVGITYAGSTSANYGWSVGALRSDGGQSDFIWKHHSSSVSGVEHVRITNAGNVGIGTSTPQAPIHANGGTAMTSGWNRTAMLSATFPVLVFNSNSTKYAGIGYDYSSNLNVWVNAATNDVVTGTNALTIAQNGNVGVGKTPTVKLDVNGTVKATAFEGPLSGTISAANVSSGSFGANTGGGNYVFPASLTISPGTGNKLVATNVPIIEGGASGGTRIFRNLANYESNESAQAGAIVINTGITHPVSAMSIVRIRGYEYASTVGPGNVIDLDIASYFNSSFSNRSYVNHGSVNPTNMQIGVGPSGTIVIVIGSITSSWSYPKLWVESWFQSHSSTSDSSADNWSISTTTDLSAYTLYSLDHEGLSSQGGKIYAPDKSVILEFDDEA